MRGNQTNKERCVNKGSSNAPAQGIALTRDSKGQKQDKREKPEEENKARTRSNAPAQAVAAGQLKNRTNETNRTEQDKQEKNELYLWSSMTFLTARRPSRQASLICAMVCLLGPLISTVHEKGLATPSTNVYTSSPSVCSYTWKHKK